MGGSYITPTRAHIGISIVGGVREMKTRETLSAQFRGNRRSFKGARVEAVIGEERRLSLARLECWLCCFDAFFFSKWVIFLGKLFSKNMVV